MHSLRFNYRKLFVFAAVSLTLVGVLFVHSAAAYWGQIRYADAAPFALKQLIYIGVSVTVAYWMMRSPHLANEKFWTFFYAAAVLMLAAVLLPGIGAVRNGSQSWIAFGPVSLQPAEFVKVALIGKLAMSMSVKPGRKVWDWRHFALILVPFALIMMQPDLGSAVIMIVSAFTVLFVAGYPLSFFSFLGLAGAGAFTALILAAPYRLDRIKSYIDPWSDPLGKGFQGIQSLFAIAPGGLLGHGFGNSRQKYLYLPEPQNDFIFSIIAEETGFLGAVAVLGLFVCLLIGAFGIAARTAGWRECLVVSGMAAIIIFQTFLNVGVVSGLLPVTGVTLPFISYGGSSMLTTWLAVGAILHFSRRTTD